MNSLKILCQNCGEVYKTEFDEYSINKSCPKCKFKLVDNINDMRERQEWQIQQSQSLVE